MEHAARFTVAGEKEKASAVLECGQQVLERTLIISENEEEV